VALLIGAAAVVISLAATGPAAGAGSSGLKYPSKVKAVPNAEPGVTSAQIACPADHPLVTGGGMEITGNESGLDLEIGSSLSGNHLKAWTGVADNSSAASAELRITAICAVRGTLSRAKEKSVARNTQGELKVSCPTGAKVIGGGVGITGDSHKQEVATTQPFDGADADTLPDDGWLGRANNGLNKRVFMTVEALCSRSGSYTYVHSTRTKVPNNAQVEVSIGCPSRTHVTGGGVDVTGTNDGVEVADSFPFDGSDADTLPDDGWRADANNDGSGAPQKMQTFAICRG
jgi:hypothetical protein